MRSRCNVGGIDRGLRAVLGVALVLATVLLPLDVVWRVVLLIVAGIAFLTVFTRYCPLNAMIGLDTCRNKPTA